ncbi:hypothetical protein XI05_01915 [Bradyrhizobium sp. CCBAU 11357]|nr:hypothetical protein [Bradyrhizobium sp. CCBAU 11357]
MGLAASQAGAFAPFRTATALHCPAVVLLGRQHGLAASRRCKGASWYESGLRGIPSVADVIDDTARENKMMQRVGRVS